LLLLGLAIPLLGRDPGPTEAQTSSPLPATEPAASVVEAERVDEGESQQVEETREDDASEEPVQSEAPPPTAPRESPATEAASVSGEQPQEAPVAVTPEVEADVASKASAPVRTEKAAQQAPAEEPQPKVEAAASSGEDGPADEGPAPVVVQLALRADPIDGTLQVAGQSVRVPGRFSLPEGLHHFVFQGPDWSTTCEKEVRAGMKSIKFKRGTEGCTLSQ